MLQCRLWYSALVKLKKHFLKQNDKITEFMTNFDPERRASLNTLTVPRTVSTMIAIPPSVVEESRISMPIVPQKQPVY